MSQQTAAMRAAGLGRVVAARGDAVSRLRLGSGVLLMIYACTHLTNHALGLISIEALEQGRHLFERVWGSPVAVVLLLAAFLVHGALGLLRGWAKDHLAACRPGRRHNWR